MAYERDRDLPKGVKDNLPPGAKSLWRRVFNAVEKEELAKCTGEDCATSAGDTARQAAWSSVKRAGYVKGEGGAWVKQPRRMASKEIDMDVIFFGIQQVLDRMYPVDMPLTTNEYDGPEVAEPSRRWSVTSVFPDGRAYAENYPHEKPAGDMRRPVLLIKWEVANDIVSITSTELGYLEERFISAASANKMQAPPTVQGVPAALEQVSDELGFIPPTTFRDVLAGGPTSAVTNVRCQKTGGDRYITVSSGTFPDRMAEIVALQAQQYAVTWAEKTGNYGPLRLAHIPHPVAPNASLRDRWQALVGDYVTVFDHGLLPMADLALQKSLRLFASVGEHRVRNLMAMVGKDLTMLVVTGKIHADVGSCDYQHLQGGQNKAYPGRFLVESGLYDDSALAYRAKAYFDKTAGEVSIGFLYDRMRLVVGKDQIVYPSYYKRMWRFERSLLPMGAAAFPASYLDGSQGVATL